MSALGLLARYGLSRLGTSIVLAKDTFTDTDGTAIASHAMDVGSGWTLVDGTLTIQGDKLTGAAGGNMAITDVGEAEYAISANIVPGCALIVRYITDRFLFANLNLANQLMELTEWNGGVVTVRASQAVALSEGTPCSVKVVVTTTGVTVTVNSGTPVSFSTSLNNASTKAGVRIFNASRDVDDFLVTS